MTAADEESALALMDGLQQLWAASGITEIRATPPTPPPASASGCTRASGAPTPAAKPACPRTRSNRSRQRTSEGWIKGKLRYKRHLRDCRTVQPIRCTHG
ncbi:hypothetical protein AB0N79_35685 [Streptomyces microflavus]